MNDKLINEHVNFSYTNSTLVDPFLSDVSIVTLNKNYLPIASRNSISLKNRSESTIIKVPANYITAKIDVYYAGSLYKSIPLLFPESASESLSANFVKENPVGSSVPIVAFANSGNSQISINFVALADYLPIGYESFEDYLNAIRSMTKPQLSGNYVKGPEVFVSLANISFYGVCDSVSIEYKNMYKNNSYSMANISCQFTRTT